MSDRKCFPFCLNQLIYVVAAVCKEDSFLLVTIVATSLYEQMSSYEQMAVATSGEQMPGR